MMTEPVRQLPSMWRLGVSSYHQQVLGGDMSLCTFLERAASFGFSTVELCDHSLSLRDLAANVQLLDAAGISSPSIAVRNDFSIASTWEAEVAHVRSWVHAAGDVGADTIRIYGGHRVVVPRARDRIVRGIDAIAQTAQDRGIRVVVETHGGHTSDVDFMLSMHDATGVGVCLDYGHLGRRNPLTDVKRLLPIVQHVHVKTLKFDTAGLEIGCAATACTAAVAAFGYSGPWIVEYEGEPPEERGIRQTIELLDGILQT